MKPRLLLALPQMPQDPASGAARTAQTACEMAAAAGWEVRGIGTTATERAMPMEAAAFLKSLALNVQARAPMGGHGRELSFVQRGISYTLLHTGNASPTGWDDSHGRQYDRLFDTEIARFRPDVILTYGGTPGDLARHRRARETGSRVAFCVFNQGYLEARPLFESVDAVLTPSAFVAEVYRARLGVVSTPLPTPLEFADVIAADHEPIFVTMVNPSVEKGLFFVARLAEELGARYPKIPMLVIEARGTAGMLVKAGEMGGFDLRRHENLMFAGATAKPRDIFQPTRVLLVPSVGPESSARVVAEALVNGIPPIVSDRGGLAESCNGAGFVLDLPSELTLRTDKPVARDVVEPWLDIIVRLYEDEAFYAAQCARAREASAMYRREILAPRYVQFFESVLARKA